MAGMSPAIFQSTRPVRGATLALTGADIDRKFQSTRPVRGATVVSVAASGTAPVFQSTRPVRGAT